MAAPLARRLPRSVVGAVVVRPRQLRLARPTQPGRQSLVADAAAWTRSLHTDSHPTDRAEASAAIVTLMRSDPSFCRALAASVSDRAAQDWGLAREALSQTRDGDRPVPSPTPRQYLRLFVFSAVPFLGFGFFDNTIMLTFGEAIDLTVGATLGLSTMAAAGIGQCFSDAGGITLQGLIERFSDSLGLPKPMLTRRQTELSQVRSFNMLSRILGVMVGCIFGMWPLLLMGEREPRLVGKIASYLTVGQRQELMRCTSTEIIERGDKLLEQGQMTTHVFMIIRGEVEVVGRDWNLSPFTVCTIGPGTAFGHPHLRRPSSCDLIAKNSEVVVDCITKEDFLRIMGDDQECLEVFESARSTEVEVYTRARGKASLLRAEKGTGKTSFFASLEPDHQVRILSFVGVTAFPTAGADAKEHRVDLFTHLSENEKRDALSVWHGHVVTDSNLEGDNAVVNDETL